MNDLKDDKSTKFLNQYSRAIIFDHIIVSWTRLEKATTKKHVRIRELHTNVYQEGLWTYFKGQIVNKEK